MTGAGEREEQAAPPCRGLVLPVLVLVAGLWVAVVSGHGLELQGMARGAALVALAGLCAAAAGWRASADVWRPGLVLGLLAVLYFVGRAWISPVWDLARLDLLLVASVWITMMVVACCGRAPLAKNLLLAGLGLSVAVNAIYAVGQSTGNPDLRLFNLPQEAGKRAVGVFGHPNSLAGYLEIVVPLLVGAGLAVQQLWVRALYWGLALSGVVAVYLSDSRGGFMGLTLGCLVVAGGVILSHSRRWSPGVRWLNRLCFVLVLVLMIPGAYLMVKHLSERRGHGEGVERLLSNLFFSNSYGGGRGGGRRRARQFRPFPRKTA